MIAGVDGCKAGWLVALADTWPTSSPQLVICRDFATVLAVTDRCAIVSVDMPIGLPNKSWPRGCDVSAKEQLGIEGQDRVFFTPPRQTLSAKNPKTFQQIHRKVVGKKARVPVWGIIPKLREVDAAMTPELQARIREFHPELVWQRLAGHTLPSKHQPDGLEMRRALLRKHVPALDGLLAWRKQAGRALRKDDLLDALAGLELAQRLTQEPPKADHLPSKPPCDGRGLRMEIWF